jgi:hypothetical protein
MRPLWGAAVAGVVLLGGHPAAQQPSMRTALERAGVYVSGFNRQIGGIVSEEHYLQDVFSSGDFTAAITGNIPGRDTTRGANPRTHRELRSDLLLIHPPTSERWVQFRDVFEVDGAVIRGRNDRLSDLFLNPSAKANDQARRISEESARYNIGNLERTINVPLMPLLFLESDMQQRFEFNKVLDAAQGASDKPAIPRDVPNVPAFALASDAWEIQYRETTSPTLIHTTGDRDMPAHGRFWIDPLTGRVLMTELLLDDPFVHGAIHVSYKMDSGLGFLVPGEMREQYVIRGNGVHIYGTATYSKFRRFEVNTDEQILPPK